MDELEYYEVEYLKLRALNNVLMRRYDKLNSKYCKLIKKYKKLINTYDKLIYSFFKVKYALKCYYQSEEPLKSETNLEHTIRHEAVFKKLLFEIDNMLTLLESYGLISEPRDTIVSNE